MGVTQFIVDGYIHVKCECITGHDFGPGEKNLVERGRKMVKNSESGIEIEYAQAWNPYKPNIFSLTVPDVALFVGPITEGILRADKGT